MSGSPSGWRLLRHQGGRGHGHRQDVKKHTPCDKSLPCSNVTETSIVIRRGVTDMTRSRSPPHCSWFLSSSSPTRHASASHIKFKEKAKPSPQARPGCTALGDGPVRPFPGPGVHLTRSRWRHFSPTSASSQPSLSSFLSASRSAKAASSSRPPSCRHTSARVAHTRGSRGFNEFAAASACSARGRSPSLRKKRDQSG